MESDQRKGIESRHILRLIEHVRDKIARFNEYCAEFHLSPDAEHTLHQLFIEELVFFAEYSD